LGHPLELAGMRLAIAQPAQVDKVGRLALGRGALDISD
jgi:hypothetical protein